MEFNENPEDILRVENFNKEIIQTENEEKNNGSKELLGNKRSNDKTEVESEKNQISNSEKKESSQIEIIQSKIIFNNKSTADKKEPKIKTIDKNMRKENHSINLNEISDNTFIYEGAYSGPINQIFEQKKINIREEYEYIKNQLFQLEKGNKGHSREYQKLEKKRKKLKLYYRFLTDYEKLNNLALEKLRNLLVDIQLEENIDVLSILTTDKMDEKDYENLEPIIEILKLLKKIKVLIRKLN